MLIGIFSRRVPDEIQNFDSDLLRLRLDATLKLGLTNSHSLESELRLLALIWEPVQKTGRQIHLSARIETTTLRVKITLLNYSR